MSATRTLLVVILSLLAIVYIQSYLKPKGEYTIVQTNLDKITVDNLHDKYPIVIHDRVQNPRELLSSLFAFSYSFNLHTKYHKDRVYKTRSKYSILYNDNEDVLVHLISPKYKTSAVVNKPMESQSSSIQYVSINLKKNQVIILPMSWFFAGSHDIKCILLDDILSATLRSMSLI